MDEEESKQRDEDLRAYRLVEAMTGVHSAIIGKRISVTPERVFPRLKVMEYSETEDEIDPEQSFNQIRAVLDRAAT